MSSSSPPADLPRLSPAIRKRFQIDLLNWFFQNRRSLPWRTRRTPYRVWISELMLQQTRVDQAAPYFLRFMRRFPSLRALAQARQSEVLKQWEGLGYYRRAVQAHRAARLLVEEHGGRFPKTYDDWLALPGVGPYTAAAIASLAYNLDHAVLDGNVIRVMSRVLAVAGDPGKTSIRKSLLEYLRRLLPAGRAADFNEALMELGAMICAPVAPQCSACPLAPVCRARRQGRPTHFPVRPVRKKIPHRHVGAGVIIDDQGRVLIARRREQSMLGGLWEFPGGGVEEGETLPICIARELNEELGLTVRVGPHLTTVRHTFSHFRMDLHAYWVRVASGRPQAIGCSDWAWVAVDQIADYALPRADQKILAALLQVEVWPSF